MLTVEGLIHAFNEYSGAEPVLDIPALAAPAGALTVISGPSGSGKTTLLYLLSGLLRAQRGAIRWDGADLAAMSEGARDRWRRRHAGFVFQNFHLIEELSAIRNVTIAAYFGGLSDRAVRVRASSLLEAFGVSDETRAVASYSRGEQQRVALARALIFDPAVIFADEPTASLDENNAARLTTHLRDLARVQGKTVLAVSHDAALIEAADQVVRLERGRLKDGALVEVAA